MKIVVAQLNNIVGDVQGNVDKAIRVLSDEKTIKSDLVVFSELFISGYPPEDLVLKNSFLDACYTGLNSIVDFSKINNKSLIIGLPLIENNNIYNCSALIDNGSIIGFSKKQNLPNYSVFDEKRVFSPGKNSEVFDFRNIRIGMPICEDIWNRKVCEDLKKDGADIIITPNGSPFDRYKKNLRLETAIERVKEIGIPLVYANQIGGQDELVFDGSSFAINSDQSIVSQAPAWKESFLELDFHKDKGLSSSNPIRINQSNELTDIYSAMVLGLKDYVNKNNIPGII